MKRILSCLILLSVLPAHAEDPLYGGGSTTPNGTPMEAFNQGKEFGALMQEDVQKSFTEAKAKETLDFSDSPPEASYYGDLPPREKGTEKQDYCSKVNMDTISEAQRKECDAVNYLTGVQNRSNPYTIDKANDPIFKRYDEGIELSKRINADTCNLEGSNIPSEGGITDVCTEAIQRANRQCNEELTVKIEESPKKYILQFAITVLLAKSNGAQCRESNSTGEFTIDLSMFSTYFNRNEYNSGNYYTPQRYAGMFQGTRFAYLNDYRTHYSMPTINANLSAGGVCHSTPNMVAALIIRPIYSADMIDFMYKIDGVPKTGSETSFQGVTSLAAIESRPAPGVTSSTPTCGLGADVPRLKYDLSQYSTGYDNGPKFCNTNPSSSVSIIDGPSGKIKINIGKGSPSFDFGYSHEMHRLAAGVAYPIRITLEATKQATKYTDIWDDGCTPFKEAK